MISRIRKSIELSAGDRRIAARMTLGFVAAILCLMLVLAGASLGLTGSLALSQPSPSASPSGSPTGPAGESGKIFLLNPSQAYEPASDIQEPPQPNPNPDEPTLDDPKISDKFDGSDSAYHIVAVVKDPPPTALVEAYWQTGTANEVTIGELSPAPGSPGTFELFWDVPSNIGNQPRGFIIVRLYQQTPNGFEQVSEDSVQVRIADRAVIFAVGGPVSAAETVELTWPSQGGPLGFYKSAAAGSVWRTVVSGTASSATPPNSPGDTAGSNGPSQVRLFYSVTPAGVAPEFTQCGTGGTSAGGPSGSRTFNITCALAGTDRPSQVTALAAVAMENHDDSGEGEPVYSQESADVHVVSPYMQRVEDMTIDLTSSNLSDSGTRRHIVQATSDDVGCLAYVADVRDAFDRPVQGANIDVHIQGPSDQVQFGDEASAAGRTSSGYQNPQKGHSSEAARDCDNAANFGQQSDHNVPGGNDIKHRESTTGTGVSGGAGGIGRWLFHIWSPSVGDTQIYAWVDDEPVADEAEKRAADDDLPETSESNDSNFAQWLPSAVNVTIDPAGATAATGTCQKYIVRVRGGTRAVRGANVDVHATGPTDALDFCDPGDGSPRRAPDAGTGHNAEDNGEMAHAGQPPVAQHTEGVTNDQGNFVVGITSPDPGDTTITAWYDAGEDEFDDDEPGGATGTATTNWAQSTGDAAISFLNPSPYGPSSEGTQVAKTQDVDAAYHIVTRVSSVAPVAGVEIFYRSGSNPLVKIADATQIGQTDVYEAYWSVDVVDGAYTLVARIRDTAITTEQSVTVNNSPTMTNPQDVPFETLEITSPLDGTRATFTAGRVRVRGVASGGTEGVDLFYTKAGPLTTPASSAWISCGFAAVGTASTPKEFSGDCQLQGSDQPALVTGLAALPYDCVQAGCNATPGAGPGGTRAPGARDSGDAHRVFGAEANPVLAMEPAETASELGECVKFVVSLTDQTGQPIPNQNLDVHMTGPGNSGNFCAPEDGSGTPRRAPNDNGHVADGNETDEGYHEDPTGRIQHTEAESTGNGRLIFGIESATAGDSQLTVWMDDDDDDALDDGERSDVSVMHWEAEDGGPCDVNGTNGPDVLEGGPGPERICGFGGNDTIRGGGGADVVLGGAGSDDLRGGADDDTIRGGGGNDEAFGGGGADSVYGGGGRDTVKGHGSDDRLRGNRGNDRLNGGSGRDDCSGGGGRDRLRKCETGTRSFAARTRPI